MLLQLADALIRQEVEVRLGARTVEVFRAGRRVAAHPRGASGAPASTLSDHMPAGHRQFAEWSAEHFLGRARRFGPSTEALIAAILADRRHPEQGCAGGKQHGNGGKHGSHGVLPVASDLTCPPYPLRRRGY